MEVIIEIDMYQSDRQSKNKDHINLKTKGILKKGEHFDMVSYEENGESGLFGAKTVLKVDKDSLTMIRYEKATTNLFFRKGSIAKTSYITENGIFELEIFTNKLDVEYDNKEYLYNINLDYNIKIQNLFDGVNKLEIKIKKAQ